MPATTPAFLRRFLQLLPFLRLLRALAPTQQSCYVRYERVHPMNGWADLKRRLGQQRRVPAELCPTQRADPLECMKTKSSSSSQLSTLLQSVHAPIHSHDDTTS
eukprot:2325594-Pleurochrysis_carterae.AAC.2